MEWFIKKIAIKDNRGNYRLNANLPTYLSDYGLAHSYLEDKKQYLKSMLIYRFKRIIGKG